MSLAILDQNITKAIEIFLSQNKESLHISAVQMSVLLPGIIEPRNYVTGTQEYGSKTPATTEMLLQWGSNTKIYTNILVLQLVEQGFFKENSTLAELFPEEFTTGNWPEEWQVVTITQLMNMTSGIPDFIDINIIWKVINVNHYYSLEDLINKVAQEQKQPGGCSPATGCFKGGSAFYYSNTNYLILGLIVEKFTKQPFAKVMKDRILATFQAQGNKVIYDLAADSSKIVSQMIHGYFASLEGFTENPTLQINQDVTPLNLSWAACAGAMIGNMAALTKMVYALYHSQLFPLNRLLQNAVQTKNGEPVTSPETQCVYPDTGFARAVIFSYDNQFGNELYYSFLGQTPGYTTYYAYFPQGEFIVAIGQNSNNRQGDLEKFVLEQITPIIRSHLKQDSKLCSPK